MKKLVLFAFCLYSVMAFAQDEVSLVVSADGVTKTQAIDNALRSAIEQTYGTFVSANTEILNDQLVKDEIATVSSGNIQKYSEIAAVTLPNGNTSVTLNVTVSLAKLIGYAQSKGSQCEFAGATFGANMRLYEFNKKNERIAIENMIKQLNAMRPIFYYKITVAEPTINDRGFEASSSIKKEEMATVRISVTGVATDKSRAFFQTLENILLSLGRNQQEISPLTQTGYKFFEYTIKDAKLFFYNEMPLELFGLLENVKYDFSVTDNNDSEYIYIYDDVHHYITVKKEITWSEKVIPWENCPFVIPIADLSTISNFSITPTVADRTCYLFITTSNYYAWAYVGVNSVTVNRYYINKRNYSTAYRKKGAPRCDAEKKLNDPNRAIVTVYDKVCNGKCIGIFHVYNK